MFNGRQFQIIELLKHKNISAKRISEIVKKSIRTIMRDISLINELLENDKIGKIIFEKEKDGYELEVYNEDKLEGILKEWINEEDSILYRLLTREFVTIDDLSEELYLSSPIISSKLGTLKEIYKNRLKIISGKKGHYLDESEYKKILVLSNLIYKKDRYFLKEMNLDINTYEKLIAYFNKHKIDILLEYPYINGKQFASIVLAIYLLKNKGEEVDSDSHISKIYKDNGLKFTTEIEESAKNYLKVINKNLKKITRGTILDILLEIEERYEIKIYDMNLVRELVLHINRSISYSFILKEDEIYNLSNIKALNPFSFDLSFIFVRFLKEETGIKIYDEDLVALYFICALERVKNSKQKILIIGRKMSLANINKNMIESNIPNVDVDIINSKEDLSKKLIDNNIALLIDNNYGSDLKDVDIKTIKVSQIISSKEIFNIGKIIENIILKENIEEIFKKEYSFEYKVRQDESWENIIKNISDNLLNYGCIDENEKNAIIEREKQDNFLIIDNISIPHCMSKRKDFCVGAFIKLSREVVVSSEVVKNIVVVVVNPENKRNSNIFSYLYRSINNNKGFEINSYEDFIRMLKEKRYYD